MARIVTPTFTTDHDGADVVLVPLATGGSAKVLVADWRNLTAAGWSPRWTLNSSGDPLHPEWAYVRVARTRARGRPPVAQSGQPR